MSYTVFTDSCSNLPNRLLEELQIRVLPCDYLMDGEPATYDGNMDGFDFHAYYDKLRKGAEIKTTLLNMHLFMRIKFGHGTFRFMQKQRLQTFLLIKLLQRRVAKVF